MKLIAHHHIAYRCTLYWTLGSYSRSLMNLPSQACRTGGCWIRIMWFTLACRTFSSASTTSSFVLGVATAPPTARQTDARVRRPGQAIDSDCPTLSVAGHGIARLFLARQRAERRWLLPNRAAADRDAHGSSTSPSASGTEPRPRANPLAVPRMNSEPAARLAL